MRILSRYAFTLLLVFHLTKAFYFRDEDTIDVEAGDDVDDFLLRSKREVSAKSEGNCKTSRGEDGECKTFKECYPIFRPPPGETPNVGYQSERGELEQMLKNVTGSCEESLLSKIFANLTTGGLVKSEEYVCCPFERPSAKAKPSRPPSASLPPTKQQCGKVFVERAEPEETVPESTVENSDTERRDFRIVNGATANRGQFPWQVALMNRGRQFCGGSLIDSSHVLTAAHCIQHMNRADVSKLRLYIGDHNIYSTTDGPQVTVGATNVYYHRGFSMRTLYHDVAVIRLNKAVSYTQYIQPICLSNGRPYDKGNTYADVSGWGQTRFQGQQSSVLRYANIKIWTQRDCERTYGGVAPAGISAGMVCAGGNQGRDSCLGDSGGPLTLRTNPAEQIGIVSWGVGCGTRPGVYTRVDQYLNWINRNRR